MNEADVDTNIVFFHIAPDAKLNAAQLVEKLEREKGVLVGGASRVLSSSRVHVRSLTDEPTSSVCLEQAGTGTARKCAQSRTST